MSSFEFQPKFTTPLVKAEYLCVLNKHGELMLRVRRWCPEYGWHKTDMDSNQMESDVVAWASIPPVDSILRQLQRPNILKVEVFRGSQCIHIYGGPIILRHDQNTYQTEDGMKISLTDCYALEMAYKEFLGLPS